MYSLDCSYYTAEFETLDELIEAVMYGGMDPSYEVTFNGEGNPSMQQPRTFTCLSKSIYKTREHYVNIREQLVKN
jgi:hypothetical protein